MSPEAALAAAMEAAFPDGPPARLGVAVSGGGDSMALLHLMAAWARGRVELAVVTVDHGLRPGSAIEARRAKSVTSGLFLRHDTLLWEGWDGTGNLQDQARQARAGLISRWAAERGIEAVATGHSFDDQAETVLMRLARGSGVDGLAGMAAARRDGVTWLRPLLAVRREALREWLRARELPWDEDPSNEDLRFDRVKARRALAALAPLGITAEGVVATAARMAEARGALDLAADRLARDCARIEAGDVVFTSGALAAAPSETRARLFARALAVVGGAAYRPRRRALDRVLGAALGGTNGTLQGCLVIAEGVSLRITREARAVASKVAGPGEIWDNRWKIMHLSPGEEVRALGEAGLSARPNWRDAGRPRASVIAEPAVFQGEVLRSAPLLDEDPLHMAQFCPSCDLFSAATFCD